MGTVTRDVRHTVFRLLAQREHSRCELERKLRAKMDADALTCLPQVLDACAAADIQSDLRFTDAYIRSRQQAGYGPLRIRQELLQRGVRSDMVEAQIGNEEHDWTALLSGVWQKKYRDEKPVDAKTQARQMRFLLHRGFSHSMINDLFQVMGHDQSGY